MSISARRLCDVFVKDDSWSLFVLIQFAQILIDPQFCLIIRAEIIEDLWPLFVLIQFGQILIDSQFCLVIRAEIINYIK